MTPYKYPEELCGKKRGKRREVFWRLRAENSQAKNFFLFEKKERRSTSGL